VNNLASTVASSLPSTVASSLPSTVASSSPSTVASSLSSTVACSSPLTVTSISTTTTTGDEHDFVDYLDTGKTVAIGKLGDIMPGVWSRPELSEEQISEIRKLLLEIENYKIPIYCSPADQFKYISLQLWEIPWNKVIENWKSEHKGQVPCFRIATPRSWATKNRVPYNREKRAAKEWRRDINTFLANLMSEREFYNKCIIHSDSFKCLMYILPVPTFLKM